MRHFILLTIAAWVYFSSCETTKAFKEQANLGKSDQPDHVILKNGSQFNYKTIKYPKQPFIPLPKKSTSECFEYWDTWTMFDDRKIERDSIYGYQLKGRFYTYINCRSVQRLRAGKINLYTYDVHSGDAKTGTDRTVYSFEKERGRFFTTAKKLTDFYNLISDNPRAAALCNQLFPGLRYSQTDKSLNNLVRIVEEYNKG